MIPNLDSPRADLAAITTSPDQIPPERVTRLVADLAGAQAALLAVVSRPSAPAHREAERSSEDRMLDVEEAAAMLGVSPRWLYRHGRTLPFTRPISRKVVRFSKTGIERWLATRRTLNKA